MAGMTERDIKMTVVDEMKENKALSLDQNEKNRLNKIKQQEILNHRQWKSYIGRKIVKIGTEDVSLGNLVAKLKIEDGNNRNKPRVIYNKTEIGRGSEVAALIQLYVMTFGGGVGKTNIDGKIGAHTAFGIRYIRGEVESGWNAKDYKLKEAGKEKVNMGKSFEIEQIQQVVTQINRCGKNFNAGVPFIGDWIKDKKITFTGKSVVDAEGTYTGKVRIYRNDKSGSAYIDIDYLETHMNGVFNEKMFGRIIASKFFQRACKDFRKEWQDEMTKWDVKEADNQRKSKSDREFYRYRGAETSSKYLNRIKKFKKDLSPFKDILNFRWKTGEVSNGEYMDNIMKEINKEYDHYSNLKIFQ